MPPVGIEYALDALSAFMATVVTLVGTLVLLYSRRSILKEVPDRFVPMYALAMLLLAGLSGIIVTADLFNLFVFEIASSRPMRSWRWAMSGDQSHRFAI
jgi:multicomponent Na+:H+ antiporter subunit D